MDEFHEYKQAKEAFIAGLHGTTLLEVVYIVCLFPFSYWFQRILSQKLKPVSTPANFILEYVTLILPLLLATTLLQEHIENVYLLILVCIATTAIISGKGVHSSEFEQQRIRFLQQRKVPFISCFRSCLLILTSLCILAVDFPIFPRRFAKTEDEGTGLMDIGIGCFIISNAIVLDGQQPKFPYSFYPLLFLGIARLVSTKGLEYQEHVSEYGVHWNFFFTLASISVFAYYISRLVSNLIESEISSGVIGSLLLCTYQALLSFYPDLQRWLLSHPISRREVDLFSQNKEGISSSVGFLGLYYMGLWLGTITRPCGYKTYHEWWRYASKLIIKGGFLWLGLLLCTEMLGIKISRRLGNLSYCLWVLAMSHLIIVLSMIVSLLPSPWAVVTSSVIVEAVNKNQLALFLLANLLTGAVNFTFRTLYTSDMKAFMILNVYLLILTGVAVIFDIWKIRLKYW